MDWAEMPFLTSGNEKGRCFFGWSKPTKRRQNICDLFFRENDVFSRKAPIQKGHRWRKAVAIRICPSSNHVSCSESAIKIYGSKEKIRARKSPETVDASGFAPDASIPVTLYGAGYEARTRFPASHELRSAIRRNPTSPLIKMRFAHGCRYRVLSV